MSGVRVLAVTNMYPTKQDPSFGVFVASQMNSVASAGAEVTILFIDGRSATWRYAAAIARVRRAATSGEFDLVHAHYGLTGFVSAFQRLPLVVSFCGDDLHGTSDGRGGLTAKSRIARRLSYVAARRADAIICKSEELRRALPREQDRVRATVIGNGVDTGLFSPGSRAEARLRVGVDPDERLVLFAFSGGQRVKRLDLAEASVARLAGAGVPVRLRVVRSVPHGAMPDYYRAADCLLLTSDSEGSPNVVKEALCCDLPVVSVDVGDVARWIRQSPGSHLTSRDPDSIAATLAEVVRKPARADGSRIRRVLGLETVAAQVLDVYRVALSRRRMLGAMAVAD